MRADMRSMIAFTAGCTVNGAGYPVLADISQKRLFNLTASIDHSYVNIINRLNGCELTGTVNGQEISLLHSETQEIIVLNLNGTKFTGKACASYSFNGEVNDRDIRLYDYDEGKYFSYRLLDETPRSISIT